MEASVAFVSTEGPKERATMDEVGAASPPLGVEALLLLLVGAAVDSSL
jgi:hypothetical protein